ncbi:hypothetical protein JTB14_036077 [Gonioctena quinquepunctata]|nr:hypothetical protein JTB14_036077 [Gonioctena quinquepunctata]
MMDKNEFEDLIFEEVPSSTESEENEEDDEHDDAQNFINATDGDAEAAAVGLDIDDNSVLNYTAPVDFNQECGPWNILQNVELPLDVLLCLFPETLLQDIAYQTNLYATQSSSRPRKYLMLTDVDDILRNKHHDGDQAIAKLPQLLVHQSRVQG